MKYKIPITVLGIITALMGLATSAQAQLNSNTRNYSASNSETIFPGIEARTVDDDFDNFFLEDSPFYNNLDAEYDVNQAQVNIDRNDDFFTPDLDENPLQITEDVEVLVNEPLAEPVNALPFEQPSERFEGIGRVEVQVEVAD